MAEIAADATEADANVMASLLEQLHHVRRRSDAMNAVKQYTRAMSPEAAQAVRNKFNAEFINGIYSQ
jgi:hypothetical protein